MTLKLISPVSEQTCLHLKAHVAILLPALELLGRELPMTNSRKSKLYLLKCLQPCCLLCQNQAATSCSERLSSFKQHFQLKVLASQKYPGCLCSLPPGVLKDPHSSCFMPSFPSQSFFFLLFLHRSSPAGIPTSNLTLPTLLRIHQPPLVLSWGNLCLVSPHPLEIPQLRYVCYS